MAALKGLALAASQASSQAPSRLGSACCPIIHHAGAFPCPPLYVAEDFRISLLPPTSVLPSPQIGMPKSIQSNLKKSYLWDSAEVSQYDDKAVLKGDHLPCGNVSEKHQFPRVRTLEIHGEKGQAQAVIALVFKQKRRAGQPAVHQPSGYSSQSPAGSKCIVGYHSKVV